MMKSDAQIAPRAAPALTRKAPIDAPPDMTQKQRQFADALSKAGAKPRSPTMDAVEGQPLGAPMQIANSFAGAPIIATTPAAPTSDAAFAAHIERVAAAIAEVSGAGAKPQIILTLPAGPTRIDGAVIGRDATGGLHITLMTTADIAPANAAQLQAQLSDRLLRREVRVAKMGMQRLHRRGSDA